MSALKLNLHVASTADDLLNSRTRPCCCSSDIESLRGAFAEDGFLVFPDAIDLCVVSDLQSKLDDVLTDPLSSTQAERIDPLGLPPTATRKKGRVLQIINVHKSNRKFREIATSPELGRLVSKLAGWQQGARLAQDQVWAKPPGAPPLVFHRDSPYFMFEPDDVVTVWVAC
ncbi:hypothetical protein THAOC_16215 [Thalassiosira oceanica]|uniref:Uncharacterized protein n=1 Tax=Thalassiosira oceanica TaxID=159749 RepID=K0SQ70_THAOC|nr:hypothetical protein THAOC_16215 [Thalassiosira oceanica]|eukprot:EJK63146.1 hypothetical protein THAOC_16215 [Thalassiosira oceanica]